MHTVQDFVAQQEERFAQLSYSRRKGLVAGAKKLIAAFPHMADASTFWRGLSARQVLEIAGRVRTVDNF